MGKFTFAAKTVPECEEFLKIQWPGEQFMTIDSFIEGHPKATEDEIDACAINYRGEEKLHKDFISEYSERSNNMKFVRFEPFMILINPTMRASSYFMKKAIDCHGTARFFTMKSLLILDTDFNLGWRQGYVPQFLFRCTYFGTAATWYSNTFDQLLQAVYWAYGLYTSVTDRDGNVYDDTWDAKKTMSLCTYEFVVGELKSRGLSDVRKQLTSCSGKIEEVRTWANYIKHKGGIDYKYLEPDDPFQIYFVPIGEEKNSVTEPPDDKFAIKNFKSPVEIDIDEKLPTLENVHQALYECITNIINLIDYDSHKLQFGGKANG
jgi:hypothetical protein